jgi:hypothetical protein
MTSFMERLRRAETEAATAESADPRLLTLERVRGKIFAI